ncbi:uncharacterized protein LOC112186771 isoform X2 [Rosa chinensis]|uniref:uncharacterized protein LOC112186771 isoform X2 n=2 Tax=Rosa chinensis TaxID=74649 RepID=UPI000D0915DF|nr:uncharacterized protein LOC112186771 isoform X2 [Rosa chinensis]
MLYFHGYCLSLINHLRPLTGAIASAGKLSPAASWCFSSNRRRSGGRGNAPDAVSDENQDPTVKPSRGPRRRESEKREENGEKRRRPSERGSQRSIQLSTISIADAEVFNYSSPSSEEKGHGDIRTRGGLHFRLDLQINLLVCCLYNIRGTDVDYGPVVHAFAIVTLNSAFFYVDKRKVESEQFKPNYTAPPPLFHYGGILMNFRGNWEISRRDLQNPGFLAMVTTDLEYMNNDLDDEYSAPSSRSLLCCRIVAITFMVLLVLRHMLPVIISGAGEYSLTLFTVSLDNSVRV